MTEAKVTNDNMEKLMIFRKESFTAVNVYKFYTVLKKLKNVK